MDKTLMSLTRTATYSCISMEIGIVATIITAIISAILASWISLIIAMAVVTVSATIFMLACIALVANDYSIPEVQDAINAVLGV